MGFGRDQPLNPFGPGGYSRPGRAPSLFWNRRFIKEEEEMDVSDGFVGAIGNTPLIRLRKLSEETGCEILGKAEFQNPGGSVKDRAPWAIIKDAEERGALRPGGNIAEGTAGPTGLGLAIVPRARRHPPVLPILEAQTPTN